MLVVAAVTGRRCRTRRGSERAADLTAAPAAGKLATDALSDASRCTCWHQVRVARRVFVGNLSWQTSWQTLKDKFGEVRVRAALTDQSRAEERLAGWRPCWPALLPLTALQAGPASVGTGEQDEGSSGASSRLLRRLEPCGTPTCCARLDPAAAARCGGAGGDACVAAAAAVATAAAAGMACGVRQDLAAAARCGPVLLLHLPAVAAACEAL